MNYLIFIFFIFNNYLFILSIYPKSRHSGGQYSRKNLQPDTKIAWVPIKVKSRSEEIEKWEIFVKKLGEENIKKYWGYKDKDWIEFKQVNLPLENRNYIYKENLAHAYLSKNKSFAHLSCKYKRNIEEEVELRKSLRLNQGEAERFTNILNKLYPPLKKIGFFHDKHFPVYRMDRRSPYEIFRMGGFDKINKSKTPPIDPIWLYLTDYKGYNENRLVYTSNSLYYQLEYWNEHGGEDSYIYKIYPSTELSFIKHYNLIEGLKSFFYFNQNSTLYKKELKRYQKQEEKIENSDRYWNDDPVEVEEIIFPNGINFYDLYSVYDVKKDRILYFKNTFRKNHYFNSLLPGRSLLLDSF